MEYYSLNNVAKKVEFRVEHSVETKKKLIKAINNIKRLDDINKLLDYKVQLPKTNWYPQIKDIYEILKFSLSLDKNLLDDSKKQGRHKVFEKYKNDIVAKFRVAGIQKYRTDVLESTLNIENKQQSSIWDEALKSWKSDMNTWIDKEDTRLSIDEMEINSKKDRFYFSDNSQIHSEFSESILQDLNNTDKFKMINYDKGNIDSLFKNIIVVDLSSD